MTTTSFVLNAASVGGPAFGPPNGWIVNFVNQLPPLATLGGPGYGRCKSVYFSGLIHLQSTLDAVPFMYLDLMDQAPTIGKMNQPYRGLMQCISLPFNSQYQIDLSDVYIP